MQWRSSHWPDYQGFREDVMEVVRTRLTRTAKVLGVLGVSRTPRTASRKRLSDLSSSELKPFHLTARL